MSPNRGRSVRQGDGGAVSLSTAGAIARGTRRGRPGTPDPGNREGTPTSSFLASTPATSGFGSDRRALMAGTADFPQPAPVALPGPRSRGIRPLTQRVRPAGAGPSEARTQEGRMAVAPFGRPRTRPRDRSAVARRMRWARGRILRDGAGGHRRHGGTPCRPLAQAARGRSSHFTADLRPAPLALVETRRALPAPKATQTTPSAREAGGKEER